MRMNNPYFHSDVFHSNSGTETIPDYVLSYDEHGVAYLKQVGDIPIYAQIQASRSQCDLENVLKSCVHSNQINVSGLEDVQNLVADFSSIQTMGELFNASRHLSSLWNDLPLEVREQFDSNLHNFAKNFGTVDFYDKVHYGYDKFNKVISNRLDNPQPQPQPQPNPQPQPQPQPILEGGDK